MCSYEAQYVKEYIAAAQPVWAVGEYWDACAYTGEAFRLDNNQGEPMERCAYRGRGGSAKQNVMWR